MELIERDIEANDGLYPFNNGRLSIAEVCRRASIHKVTLQGAKHKSTTRVIIKEWLENLDKLTVVGAASVRKRVTASAEEWRERYLVIARKYNELYAIHIVSMQKKLDLVQSRLSELESENMALIVKLSARGVSLISDGKRKKDKS
jgi:hypothetical protein